MRLLVVDDSHEIRVLIKASLAQYKCQVLEADTAQMAIDKAIDEQPSLILLDIHLRNDNGLDVLERMRSNPSLSKTPVIIMSSETRSPFVKRAARLRASGFLAKPVERDTIVERVRKHMSLKARASGQVIMQDTTNGEKRANPLERHTDTLIVESDDARYHEMERILRNTNWKCKRVNTLGGAPEIIKAKEPEVVFINLTMNMLEDNALKLLRQLKSEGLLDGIIPVGLAPNSATDLLTSAEEIGINHFIFFPYTQEKLTKMAFEILDELGELKTAQGDL